jgi:DNA polymerase-3 subunit epsilon
MVSGATSINACPMALLDHPLATMEFLALDTETNGLSGASCEMTEVGAVLVGGGELHERWSSLVRTNMPLGRGIQRFTGITQAEIDSAPDPERVLPELARRLHGRVLVAHNAPFDTRVLRQAFEHRGLIWPDPPALCTAQLARRLLPLQKGRKLAVLADALGIEVDGVHRALVDAETCARIFCALFTKLCGAAGTVGEAIELLGAGGGRGGTRSAGRGAGPGRRTVATREPRRIQHAAGARELPQLEFGELPTDPGVYIFRDARGAPLYVGKSVSIRTRARAHFAPATQRAAWTQHAEVVDYRATASELGALVTENRLIKELAPPGNVRLTPGQRRRGVDLVYIRCRLDIPFPILEVSDEPAGGLAVNIGPLEGREWVTELVEQLESLHQLRHCGRRLPRRENPSVYGQMGRCLSPCLGDLDPNLYRRRLDQALAPFLGSSDAQLQLLAQIDARMREAAAAQQYERAAALRRRRARCGAILANLQGRLHAAHTRPVLVLAPHPAKPRFDALWLAAGRLLDFGPLPDDLAETAARTDRALGRAGRPQTGAHIPPAEVDELRIVTSYLTSHPELPQLALSPAPSTDELERFISAAQRGAEARSQPRSKGRATTSAPSPSPLSTRAPGAASRRTKAKATGPTRGDSAALVTVATTRPS